MEHIKNILQKLNLTEKEVDVYLASIKIWTSASSGIVHYVDLPKSTIKYTLESLVKKNLLIKSKKWITTYFTPEHPAKLKNLLIVEKNELESKEKSINNIMWDLIWIYNPYTKLPKVTFYEGIEPVMKMLINNHAKIENDTYEFSAHIPLLKKYPKEISEYSDIHMEYRKKHQNYVLDCIETKEKNDNENYPNLHFKYYPEKDLDIKTHLQIDGDNIAIISMHWDQPMWIDIHHKDIANDLKKIFKQLWNNLPDSPK